MATLRIGDDAGFKALAEGCGCTLAKVKLAIESVGYDELDIVQWLHRRRWITEDIFQALSARVDATPLFESGLEPEANADESDPLRSKKEVRVRQRPHWRTRQVVVNDAAAETHQLFHQFLKTKMAGNMTLQNAYTHAQADGASEVVATRRLVIALVEAHEFVLAGRG